MLFFLWKWSSAGVKCSFENLSEKIRQNPTLSLKFRKYLRSSILRRKQFIPRNDLQEARNAVLTALSKTFRKKSEFFVQSSKTTKTFSQEEFLKNLPAYSYQVVLTTLPQIFCQSSENFPLRVWKSLLKLSKIYKMLKFSCWTPRHYERSLEIPDALFSPNSKIFFLKFTNWL